MKAARTEMTITLTRMPGGSVGYDVRKPDESSFWITGGSVESIPDILRRIAGVLDGTGSPL